MKSPILLSLALSLTIATFAQEQETNSTQPSNWGEALYQGYCLAKSAAFFHVSGWYNAIKYGSVFNYQEITGTPLQSAYQDDICVARDNAGNITHMHDGKKTPLVLGSIPRSREHIECLKKDFSGNGNVGIYALNRDFERNWAGETELANNNDDVYLFTYPTTDYNAPSFIDLLRAVRDLDNRDSYGHSVAYVHCKAGRGRSAVTIAAYLSHVLQKTDSSATPSQIESYLQKCRPQVKLNSEHNQALTEFQTALEQAGSLENLCDLHADAMAERDTQLA